MYQSIVFLLINPQSRPVVAHQTLLQKEPGLGSFLKTQKGRNVKRASPPPAPPVRFHSQVAACAKVADVASLLG